MIEWINRCGIHGSYQVLILNGKTFAVQSVKDKTLYLAIFGGYYSKLQIEKLAKLQAFL